MDHNRIKDIIEDWEKFVKPEIHTYQLKLRVIENYEANHRLWPYEISIKKGEILIFKDRMHLDSDNYKNRNWDGSPDDYQIYCVKANGRRGSFPARCVEVIQENNDDLLAEKI